MSVQQQGLGQVGHSASSPNMEADLTSRRCSAEREWGGWARGAHLAGGAAVARAQQVCVVVHLSGAAPAELGR
jgi:hypothetical protein